MPVILNVPAISCEHCKTTIEGAVNQLDGVSKAEVDIDRRTVVVDFDENQVTLQEIVDAMDEVGYEVAR
jgi:copper chaperone